LPKPFPVASIGLIVAKVVQVDAANDLALLKADGKFSPLPIAASRSAHLGGTVATIGFPDIGLQGFAPKVLAHGHHGGNRHWEVELRPGDDPRYFQIRSLQTAIMQTATVQPGRWQHEHRPLVDEQGNVIGIVSAKLGASVVLAASGALPEVLADGHQLNYAVKSSLLLSFLESVPESLRTATKPSSKRRIRRMKSLRMW
jgi:S1-C subfamily serine protease